MPELPKTYTPSEAEERWYQRWLDDKCFEADPARVSEKRPAYSIVIPPPNVTGILTLGHVLNNTIQDILCRRARMLGKEVLWLPGTDHAGIATQNVVEKTLKKQGVIKHRDDLGREKLVEKIWEWKEKHGGIIIQQLKKLGASCDWSRERFTFDEDYNRCVMQVFVDLYKKGLIYRGKRMVNWCPSSLTALSDEEVEMKQQNGFMYHFKVQVIDDSAEPSARPRAVDITAKQEESLHNEHTRTDTRTGLSSYITGSRFDERAGSALSTRNRCRVGQAQALYRELAGGGKIAPDGQAGEPELRSLRQFAEPLKLPLLSLESLGIRSDAEGVLVPADGTLTKLKAGAEAQPFADAASGVVYKVFALSSDGFVGKKLSAQRSEDGQWIIENEPSSALEALEKLTLLHEIGGTPTEIIGLTETGDWLIAQPVSTPIEAEELGKARAEAVAAVGGVQVAQPGLEDIRIVWHQGRAWMIGDLHVRNIMRDSEGQARIMDALILPVPERMARELPAVREAIREARAKADQLSTAEHAQAELSLFPSPARKTWLTIATTRPETIPGDSAVAVNPNDERYKHLIGKHIRRPLPLENQAPIPIVGDEHVDFEFGTGVLKVTPAHDKADFEIGQRHGLEIIDILHPNAVLNDLAGKDLAGLERFEGRKKAVELLKEMEAFIKEEPHQNNVGYSERAGVPIEPRLSEQWFLKYPSVKEARECVEQTGGAHAPSRAVEGAPAFNLSGNAEAGAPPETREGACAPQSMRFYPDRWAKVYDHWMGGLQDWCISRQVWWGHRVPVWYRDEEVYCGVDAPEGEGWEQDPDVLDTWFSSWLWPFATMGWPNKTDDLKAFYPTTDLVTGPDIIFFWVARMIMAGYEWMGEMPFKNVYFTGIIRDKQGRKMSKSLGNSPDPLELIANYSADALRFGIMRSAPLGQDIAFDEKNVELGRNFCTKLWNASRFRQMQGGSTETEINPELLSSDDKWILLRLNTAIAEVTTALEEYRFSDATATLYRFFWSEYCDWYVEASKAVLQSTDEKRKSNTLAVIDFVLGNTLRLFHPFLPFITEELWHGMGFNEDLPENQGGKSIMFAPWPKPLDADELAYFGILPEDEKAAHEKYEAVNLGRGLKSSFNITKKVRFVLKPNQELPAHEIEVLRILLNAEPLDVDAAYTAPKGTPSALTPLGTIYLPLDGLIDVEAERARITKELAKADSELQKVCAKLADENFTAKVPQKVLDEHQQRKADWKEKKAKLEEMMSALG
jgi:valyl-tRNA synthetase